MPLMARSYCVLLCNSVSATGKGKRPVSSKGTPATKIERIWRGEIAAAAHPPFLWYQSEVAKGAARFCHVIVKSRQATLLAVQWMKYMLQNVTIMWGCSGGL